MVPMATRRDVASGGSTGRDIYGQAVRSRVMPDLSGTAYGVSPTLRRNVEHLLETAPLPNGRQNNTDEPVARHSESDWHLGPQLKDKPGSQGTLFSGGTKYSSDARFPRGYTPERREEVAGRIVAPSGHPRDEGGVRTGTRSLNYKDVTYGYKGSTLNPPEHVSREPIRRVVDTVARSTVPASDLEDKSGGQLTVRTGIQFAPTEGDSLGTAGQYHAFVRHPEVHLGPGFEDKPTVIHEIGHHVSHQQGTDHSEYYNAREQGQEEAFADNYADTHYRDRKGRPEPRGTYAGGIRSPKRNETFFEAYHGMRETTGPQLHPQDNRVAFPNDPEARVHPGGSRDVPMLRKTYQYGDVKDKAGNTYFDQHAGISHVEPDALPSGVKSEDVIPKHVAEQRWITQDHKYDGYRRGLPVREEQFHDVSPELGSAIKDLLNEAKHGA
jgi:hypothetical protein